jgi:hypothetical protein
MRPSAFNIAMMIESCFESKKKVLVRAVFLFFILYLLSPTQSTNYF